jgi:hypothetical protein
MIAYCPLEDPVQNHEREREPRREPRRDRPVMNGFEETELNYVIMGFIVGVILLAVMDSTSRTN